MVQLWWKAFDEPDLRTCSNPGFILIKTKRILHHDKTKQKPSQSHDGGVVPNHLYHVPFAVYVQLVRQ